MKGSNDDSIDVFDAGTRTSGQAVRQLLRRADGVMAIAIIVLLMVGMVLGAVLFTDCCEEQRGNAVQTVLLALATVTGYFLNSTADQRRKDESQHPPPAEPSHPAA